MVNKLDSLISIIEKYDLFLLAAYGVLNVGNNPVFISKPFERIKNFPFVLKSFSKISLKALDGTASIRASITDLMKYEIFIVKYNYHVCVRMGCINHNNNM